jgi:hypothetical protein
VSKHNSLQYIKEKKKKKTGQTLKSYKENDVMRRGKGRKRRRIKTDDIYSESNEVERENWPEI